MTDIATLGLQVESQSVDKGTKALNELSNAAKRAEAAEMKRATAEQSLAAATSLASERATRAALAEERLSAARRKAAAAMQAETNALTRSSAALKSHTAVVEKATNATNFQLRNLRFQLFDVAQTAALGLNPVMILLQQGPQIAQIYGSEEGGLGRAFKETGVMIRGMITPTTVLLGTFIGLGAAAARTFNETLRAGDLAKRLDLSLESAQELEKAFTRLGDLSGEDFGRGATALALEAGRAARDAESQLSRLFKANNLSITERSGELHNVNRLLMDASRLVANAKTEFDKIEIVRILGLSEDWVKVLEKGPAAIAQAQAEARATGALIDAEMVQRAKQFEKDWKSLGASFSDWFNAGIVNVGSSIFGLIAKIKEAGAEFRSAFPNLSIALGSDPNSVGSNAPTPENLARKTLGGMMSPSGGTRISNVFAGVNAPSNAASRINSAFGVFENAETSPGSTIIPSERRARQASQSDYQREVQSIRERTEALQVESRVVGLSTFAAEKMRATLELEAAARRDGKELTAQQRLEIEQLATGYANAAAAAEKATEADRKFQESISFAKEVFTSFLSDLRSGLANGEGFFRSLGNAALSVLDKITARLEDGLVDKLFASFSGSPGSSGVGGIFGSLFSGLGSLLGLGGGTPLSRGLGSLSFGGPREHGGPVAAGRAYIVGEKRPELFVPRVSGTIMPRLPAANSNSGGGAVSVNFAPVTSIDARGADPGVETRLQAMLDQRDRQFKAQLPAMIKDAQRRSALR